MTAILTLQGVDKSFGSRRVLDGADLAVHARDRVGVVGLNGAGKSTLLKILVGDDTADHGLVTRRRGLTQAYVAQEPRFADGQTVAGSLAEGLAAHAGLLERLGALESSMAALEGAALSAAIEEQAELHDLVGDAGWDRDHELRSMSAALALPPGDALVSRLSGGERRRVALARALLGRPELLALDEPTNHLDARTVEWLEEQLRGQLGALLLVTHDRYFLDRVATRIVEVDRGKLYSSDGGYTDFLQRQAERLADESGREQARRSFIRRELDWIRRGPAARTTKQQARIQRFDAAVAAAPTETRASAIELRLPTGGRLGKTILELDGVGQVIGGRRLFSGLSLIIKPGDRIGVVGDNGVGKTTLVRTILGQLPPAEGRVVVGLNTRISSLDQMRAELDDNKTVLQEVSDGNDHVVLEDGPVHVRTFLRMLRFDDGFADTPIGVLSGGERNRVQLARLLRKGGNLLILDEPTNDLDLITLSVLEDALVDFAGCALVVSHDRWFLDKVATGILAFEGEGRVVFYEGNYTSYLGRRPGPATATAAPRVVAPKTPAPPKRKLGFKEQKELDGIEAAIAAAEGEVARLETAAADPSLYKERGAEVPSLLAALEAARAEVERLYARWQALESAVAQK